MTSLSATEKGGYQMQKIELTGKTVLVTGAAGFIGNKLAIPAGQMFFRAVLCNFFVCLGVLCGMKLKSDAGRFLMITMCISGFVVSGFEHCIANMGSFVTAYCLIPGLSIGAMVKSMVVVTLGNMVGGALLLAWPLRKMSADK